jgi:hypothetical protein
LRIAALSRLVGMFGKGLQGFEIEIRHLSTGMMTGSDERSGDR